MFGVLYDVIGPQFVFALGPVISLGGPVYEYI
jgi:hypothetical protein